MDKKKFPREGAAANDDGLPADDTEGHRSIRPDPALNRTGPGTGGDEIAPRRPSSGGELIDETDVEGHGLPGTGGDLHRRPGTGGDVYPRRPTSGGELIDDTQAEGH